MIVHQIPGLRSPVVSDGRHRHEDHRWENIDDVVSGEKVTEDEQNHHKITQLKISFFIREYQGNVIHSNISFNAFLMPEKPKISPTLKHVQMTRHLLLEDDMKEYWGFYLLKGSKVIVSSCSR